MLSFTVPAAVVAHAGHVHDAGRSNPAFLLLVAAPFVVATFVGRERSDGAVLDVVLFSAAAGFIHAVVTPGHFQEGLLAGLFTLAVTLAQMGFVVAGLNGPARNLWVAAAAGNAAVLAVWVLSRTVGLPFGPQPWTPEPVGVLDLACGAYEVAIVTGCLAHLTNALRHEQENLDKLAKL